QATLEQLGEGGGVIPSGLGGFHRCWRRRGRSCGSRLSASLGRAREDGAKQASERRQDARWVPVHGTPFVAPNMPFRRTLWEPQLVHVRAPRRERGQRRTAARPPEQVTPPDLPSRQRGYRGGCVTDVHQD